MHDRITGLWLDRARGDHRRHEVIDDGIGIAVLIETRQYEPGVQLSANLVLEGVTEDERFLAVEITLPLRDGQTGQVGIGQLVPDLQSAGVRRRRMEDENRRIEKAGEQRAAPAQDTERLPPPGTDRSEE